MFAKRMKSKGTARYQIVLSCILLVSSAMLVTLLIFPSAVEAHPPENMVLEYDFDSRTLNVTITHPVGDPSSHFVEKVKVEREDVQLLEEKYSSQPEEDTFTYSYIVDTADEDTLEVVAECNVNGEIVRDITVHGEDRPMNLSHSPTPTELEEGSDQIFTITIESDGNPVELVDINIVPTFGEATSATEDESGSYSFNYSAPRVLIDTPVWINLTGIKDGYDNGGLSIQFNVTNIPSSNTILIDHSPDPVSLNEEGQQEITLDLVADTLPLEGALLDVFADVGLVTGITEDGGGVYTFKYEASEVDENLSVLVHINASREGYDNGTHSIDILIVNLPDPLSIQTVTFNETMETGSNQTLTILLESDMIGVDGVDIMLVPDQGSTSGLLGTGGGSYSFTYHAPEVIAESQIIINVTGRKDGYETSYLDIQITVFIIPQKPINLLCVKLFPEDDPIMEGTTMNFTIYVLYDCDPFQGADVEMSHTLGAVSNIHEKGNGLFTFSYFAPDIENDTVETFTITGIKDGYGELTRAFNYTIERVEEKNDTRSGTRGELTVGENLGIPDGEEIGKENDAVRSSVVLLAASALILFILLSVILLSSGKRR